MSSFFGVFKQFATGTRQGSTLEKTGDKMGIMTGLRGRQSQRAPKLFDSFNLINSEATSEGNAVTCRLIKR